MMLRIKRLGQRIIREKNLRLVLCFCVFFCCSTATTARPPPTATTAAVSSLPPRLSGGDTPTTATSKPTKDVIVQIYETEVWNGKTWKAPDNTRWTHLDGRPCAAPPKMDAPLGHAWEDGWKIVTTNRDAMGWEYVWHKSQHPSKRRTWLRTAKPIEKETAIAKQQRSRRRGKVSLLLRDVVNDWNFKGFGWAFYKSLIFKKSCGISVRMPLTTNFDWFDRHPAFPSVTTSMALYYPFMAVVFINMSMNVEWLKYQFDLLTTTINTCIAALVWFVSLVVTFPLWLISSRYKRFLFQSTRQSIFKRDKVPPPQYSLELQERVGMSVSWRISQLRGYEYRVSYWYMCLPTLLYCGRLLMQPLKTIDTFLFKRQGEQKRAPSPLTSWLQQHTGSLGVSTGAPIPDYPHFSAAMFMSLSGFFYGHKKMSSNRKQQLFDHEEELESTTASLKPSVLSSSTTANNSTESDMESSSSSGMRIPS